MSGGSGATTIGTSARSAAACTRSIVSDDQQPHRNRRTRRRLLRLDLAEVEQVVDDAREAIGLAHDPVGELLHDARVVGRGHRLGEQPERADRRLQLVAHVGDEVAAHALDAPRLGDVARERDRADDLAVAPQRERAQLEHLTGRPVELELALRRDAVERGLQQLVDRVLGEHLAVTRAVEPAGRRVAHDLATDAVDDDDRVGRLVERGEQPVLHRLGTRDPVGRLPVGLGDRIDERDVVAHVRRLAAAAQLAPRLRDHEHTATAAASHPTTAITTTNGVTPTPRITSTRERRHSPEPTGDVTLGARVGRVREHLVGDVVLDEAPGAAAFVVDVGRHERGHVGDARGLLHVVRDDHDRVVALQVGHEIFDARRRDRVERRARLVHQDHVGLDRETARDAQPLLLTARERERRLS